MEFLSTIKFIKEFLEEERMRYLKEFFKTGNKEWLDKIKNIDKDLYLYKHI